MEVEKSRKEIVRIVIIIFFQILVCSAKAEYRVYLLQIKNRLTQQVILREHTLDPVQYRSIYGLGPDEDITYIDTWMCRGRTSFMTEVCAKPE